MSSSSDDEDYREAFEPEAENEKKAKVQPMFTGQGVSLEGASKKVNYSKFEMNAGDDPELSFAIRMSMSEVRTPSTISLEIREAACQRAHGRLPDA